MNTKTVLTIVKAVGLAATLIATGLELKEKVNELTTDYLAKVDTKDTVLDTTIDTVVDDIINEKEGE